MQHGLFRCDDCGEEWADEIPGLEGVWPSCCGLLARLLYPLLRLVTSFI